MTALSPFWKKRIYTLSFKAALLGIGGENRIFSNCNIITSVVSENVSTLKYYRVCFSTSILLLQVNYVKRSSFEFDPKACFKRRVSHVPNALKTIDNRF